jgi:hypothetical protein
MAARRPRNPLGLAGLAALRLVLEVLVGEKLLLAGRPDELRAAIHAREDSVLELHGYLARVADGRLLQLPSQLLPIALACQRLLGSPLITRLQIEGMLLDVLDDVFLLYLALEPSESALDGLPLLDFDFRHAATPPQCVN